MDKKDKNQSGQNRCRRCDKALTDPNDIYGWRCAEIVGLENHQRIASMLDENSLKEYNAYVSAYLVEDDNSGKIEKVSWMEPIKEGAALHNVDIQVEAMQQNDGAWYANVTVTDTFDFTEFVNPFTQNDVVRGVLWAANDIAYFDTKWGLLDSVDVKIKFSDFY